MTRFTFPYTAKLMVLSISMLIAQYGYSTNYSDSCRIVVIGQDTFVLCPLSAVSNSAQAILYNEANVEYIKVLHERLSDCAKVDSAMTAMVGQYKQVVILKQSQLDLCMDAATTCEKKYGKAVKQNKDLKKVVVPSLVLNILLILLVL